MMKKDNNVRGGGKRNGGEKRRRKKEEEKKEEKDDNLRERQTDRQRQKLAQSSAGSNGHRNKTVYKLGLLVKAEEGYYSRVYNTTRRIKK